jgi:hypothetical protein
MKLHKLTDDITDAEIIGLSALIIAEAEEAFITYPPPRRGAVLDFCQELIDMRDAVDREIWWRAIVSSHS